MLTYGIQINNYEAGSVCEVNNGVRDNYDCTRAMLTNSLFTDFLLSNGLNVHKEKSTRDVICLEFNYGSRSFEEEMAHIYRLAKDARLEYRIAKGLRDHARLRKAIQARTKLQHVWKYAHDNEDKYQKLSADSIREIFYVRGVTITYFPKYKTQQEEKIHYKMLYRTPGKAKKGSCMFIRDSLYEKAKDFLYMGIQLPKKNAPIVEIGAYASLITSSIINKIQINPHNILIINDVDCSFITNAISVELNKNKQCVAKLKNDYEVTNTIFDGQALIDLSIFPSYGDGYILLRHHFTKMAAFATDIQKFFKDYFGDKYKTAKIVDMFGNEHYAKDIKLITTDNAVKWLKFNITYEYWCQKVQENGCMFGVVKTSHESKLGDVQRMSYQMVNALDIDSMDEVCEHTVQYINALKNDTDVFIDYLRKNANYSNDYEVLVALYEQNNKFERCDYFRYRKKVIIQNYLRNLKFGHIIQNADNLTIVGSPYAMLLHSVGEDIHKDPTFVVENDCIQCCTNRFDDDVYLAEFRNPFNSRNNLGYLHNHIHPYINKYFNFGKLVIAVNMIGTDFQARNNGSDQDSDSLYVTDHHAIVKHAKDCYKNYPTIVNNIPQEKNHYNNSLKSFAKIDNNLAAAQLAIGESSNLAQICLTYTYNFDNQKYTDYVCILSVLAQCAIDNAKRKYDVDISQEIQRIKNDIQLNINKYPSFWLAIRKNFKKEKINSDLQCPMNYIFNLQSSKITYNQPDIKIKDFFCNYQLDIHRNVAKRIEKLIQQYSLNLYDYNMSDDGSLENYLLLKSDFEDLITDIRKTVLPNKYIGLISWLLNRAFIMTPNMENNRKKLNTLLHKNKSMLLKTLYDVNPESLLRCFANQI